MNEKAMSITPEESSVTSLLAVTSNWVTDNEMNLCTLWFHLEKCNVATLFALGYLSYTRKSEH